MATVPKNASSYDTGNKPYKHDVSRGKWSSLTDFYCACMSHSFGVRHFSVMASYLFQDGGVLFIIPYSIGLFLFAIPIFFVQSFLGQFSNSGNISVFRISPLFKGLGYTILCLNLMSASYYAILTAIPLVYAFASFNPTLPWMTCGNSWNTENCTVLVIEEDNNTLWYWNTAWSSVEYFHHGVCQFEKEEEEDNFQISWRVAVTTILVWLVIGAILVQGIEMIGTILRYFTITIFAILIIILLRILFIENAMTYVLQFFKPDPITNIPAWFLAPISTIYIFGAGWGTILTLASFNNFKEDVGTYSKLIGFSQLGLLIITGFISQISTNYMHEFYHFDISYYYMESISVAYGAFPYFFGVLNWSNLWSILFFIALFLGELSGCIIQILSVVTAIFDEFEPMRIYKREFTIILLTILLIVSMFFTSNFGIYFMLHFTKSSGVLAIIICFIELMIIVWIYGRLRFQRDVKFMTNITYASWKYYLIRFVTPIFILLSLLLYGLEVLMGYTYSEVNMEYALILKSISLLIIPIYFYWKLQSSSGNLLERFKRLCRPTDWYPADPIDRRNYDDLLAASSGDISNQLIDDINLGDLEYTDDN